MPGAAGKRAQRKKGSNRNQVSLRRSLLQRPGVMERLVPRGVRWVLDKLAEAGHEAVLVGGCVRDLLLGRTPKDWDVATSAQPAEVQRIFPRTRPTGIAHGTVTVLAGSRPVEVTTYRVEGPYTDHRRPDSVSFTTSLEEDLGRRDFTINAMALKADGTLVDPWGGLRDLTERRVRAVGDPEERFNEDALRMLRAIRFAAQLEFHLDPSVREAITRLAPLLDHVSRERIRDEFNRIIMSRPIVWAMNELKDTGLLARFIPELLDGVGVEQNIHHRYTVWEHNIRACEAVKPVLHLRLAALFHDIAKPHTLSIDEQGNRHFYHHEVKGAEMTNRIMRRLRYDNETRKKVVHLVRHHLALHLYRDMTDAGVRRLLRRIGVENLEDLILLRMADRKASGTKRDPLSRGTRRLLQMIEKVLQEDSAFGLKDLAVNGHDVMAVLGTGPGPHVGRILQALLEMVLDDPALNQREALLAKIPEVAAALEGPV